MKGAHIMKDQNTKFATILLACFALLPSVQAVNPPPDGGYPGGNTAEGQNALLSLSTGTFNTAVGLLALGSNTGGSFNTGIGAGALLVNTISQQNTATGAGALVNSSGGFNTANGAFALAANTGGSSNTAIGAGALGSNTAGSSNIALGQGAGANVTTANGVICIGHPGQNVEGGVFFGGIYNNVQPIVGTDPDYVTISGSGRLGRGNVSSRRYKHDIQPMDTASQVIYGLKPVSFRYHKEYDATQTPAFGLIAEEVAEVAPDLVGRNRQGQPESVRYEQINAMLLNEFLKEHRKVEKLEATVLEQQKQIKALTAGLEKVSAQLKMNKTPRVVENTD
jgi:trimeric autotransporter adhesin